MITAEYKRWLDNVLAGELLEELKTMADSEKAVEDAFFKSLEFGTGGLRGVIGAGTNRMNIYTVARASLGLAKYISNKGGKSIAIGYDTRINSLLFAKTTACVFVSLGLKAYIYEAPLPTPMLSFAVRSLGCDGGVMITASHNPSEYNGYKVYGSDGCQITDIAARDILCCINEFDYFDFSDYSSFDEYLKGSRIEYISDEIFSAYIASVEMTSMLYSAESDKSVKIIYTPLNGTGYVPVLRILEKNGYKNLITVKEQTAPDGNFPTCRYPNPEIREALTLGLEYAEKNGADILLATDPDCDRVGVAVKSFAGYKILTGNEVGFLILDYIASQMKKNSAMPDSPLCVKTIVTTELAASIAQKYGIETVNVLTGFKYIGEKIGELESKGEEKRYILGFEESCGYLGGTYVRDKDGVYASFIISEMAAYYKAHGGSLFSRLCEIYREFGYEKNSLFSYGFPGADGFDKMKSIMSGFRGEIYSISNVKISKYEDYLLGVSNLPKSNVVKFYLEDASTVVIRPSGTEPKLKIYISVTAENEETASIKTEKIKAYLEEKLK